MAETMTLLVTTLVIFVGAILIYYLSYLFFGSSVATEYVLKSNVDGSHKPANIRVPANRMDKLAGYADYSFSMWLYINDFQTGFGQPKILLGRGSGNTVNPEVFIESDTNTLCLALGYHAKGSTRRLVCKIPNVPVQRWVNLTANVLSNGVNVYLNGRLFRACSVPPGEGPLTSPGSAPLQILPTVFGGQVSGIFFRNKSMSADEINAVYHAGPGASTTGLLTTLFGIREIQFVFTDTGARADNKYTLTF
jgi:hypothetical protein